MVPVPLEPRTTEGRQFADSDLQFIEPGVTARTRLIEELGQPTIWLAEQRVMVYGLRKVDAVGALWFLGAGYRAAGGLVEGETKEGIFIALDGDEIVSNWGRRTVSRGETWLTAATEWSRSASSGLKPTLDHFVEQAPTADESLVYFYRPRDFQHYLPLVAPARKLPADVAEFADIRLDDKLVGQIRWQSYVLVRVPPGPHEFTVDPDTDFVVNPGLYSSAAISLHIAPGTATFVDVGIEAGRGVIKPILAERPRADAISIIEKLRESW